MEEIRKMTGICPQHDVLFDELSPREHLQFFARIRVRLAIYFHGSDFFGTAV
jgi:ABC-type multidrug transport system ATPase subunit